MAENQKQGVYTVFADGGEVCSGSAHLVAFVGAALGAMNREVVIQLPSGEWVEVVRGDAAKGQPVSMEEIEIYLAAQETSTHSD